MQNSTIRSNTMPAVGGADIEANSGAGVSGDEYNKIVYAWNSTDAEYDRNKLIHEVFEEQVSKTPTGIATVFEHTTLTYQELNRRANQLAWYLRKRGVGPNVLVGVYLDRSHEMIVTLLGILKSGGGYVPLEPSYPKLRIETILRSAGAPIVITLDRYRDMVSSTGVEVISIDGDKELIEREEGLGGPRRIGNSDSVAYVIFTSGSTGAPKGVVVEHRPVINLMEWEYKTFGFGPEDSVLFINALSFDLSVWDIFGMLGCGGRVHIVGDKARNDLRLVAGMLCEQEITFWNSAPAALRILIPYLNARRQSGAIANTRLRLVFLSGDWIPLSLPAEVRAVFPGVETVSLGGATEATVWSNYFIVKEVDPSWRSIPYGRPIQNAKYYILDENRKVSPTLVEGDLYIGGDCLCREYLNAPEVNSTSFIPDPFCGRRGARLYRTGDRARWFADGNIEFLGRKDFQVKVRGFRIELGEIEHALGSHPEVKDAIAVVRGEDDADKKIVAYVVKKGEGVLSSRDLRMYLGDKLPTYMVPNLYVFMDRLPINNSGKVDRKALPWPVTGEHGAIAAQY